MKTRELDYHLPEHLIATTPAEQRSCSRLLVLERATGRISDRHFSDLADYLAPGDCLVLNDSRVIPARFYLQRSTGGRIEALYLGTETTKETETANTNGPDSQRETNSDSPPPPSQGRNSRPIWRVLLKNASRVKPGETLRLICEKAPDTPAEPATATGELTFTAVANHGQGVWQLAPGVDRPAPELLDDWGHMPLPPYIMSRRPKNHPDLPLDRDRYQTVYAHQPGSVAAPTAGLHFTEELLHRLEHKGIRIARVTLHVGLGTFRPIETETLEEHPMHSEYYQLSDQAAETINTTRREHGRVIAVGTTSVRTLESVARTLPPAQSASPSSPSPPPLGPNSGWTDLLISPGYRFGVIDGMITNFHLPQSTLLALVFAFAGTTNTLKAYQHAIEQEYRFYSYGDAMLIL